MLRKTKIKFKGWMLNVFFSFASKFKARSYEGEFGLNFIGYARAEMGLGEAMRMLVGAVNLLYTPFLVRDFNPTLRNSQNNNSLSKYLSKKCSLSINCICIGPDLVYRLPIWLDRSEWLKKYNIGYWYWELARIPQEWKYVGKIVDEIWVNTEFVAQSMREICPKVIKIPFGVEFDVEALVSSRATFGLPDDKFIFLCSFDFNSSLDRKNPKAVIDAFLKAYPSDSDNVILAIKSINGAPHNPALAELKKYTISFKHIVYLDEYLNGAEMRSLLAVSDCYVSLHRSEGLGLGLAESMYLGKPVIATAYSGNMEFMNEDNSCLVPFELIPVERDQYLGWEGQVWADPNVEMAAELMKKIVNDDLYRHQIGHAAACYMREHHSHKVVSLHIDKRLFEIREEIGLN